VSLLFSRTFFGLQKPWATTALAVVNMVVNAAVAFALYRPLGIAGIVIGTVAGTLVMTTAQGWILRRDLGGIEGRALVAAVTRMLAAGAALAAAAYGAWYGLDELLGRSLLAQVATVGAGVTTGVVVYAGAVRALRVPEADQVLRLIRGRRA
jgi:putative peptidoglycan lipid II flippase